ncbi:MAG TPA: CpsD/CapB family tyrosine-protein kinase [Acidimicrobiia bacterium]|nr:CpsD/CapB family tyrosine-protein kinase [Acidimicrobiia bacterium]
MTLLGLVGGVVFGGAALRPAYESRAAVLVYAITDDPSGGAEPVDPGVMGTERELVSADGVAALVRQRTGWAGSLDDLRRPLRVSQRAGTRSLTVAYRAGSPERARLGAQAFAESYLTFRTALADDARSGSRRNLEAALRDVGDRVARVRASLRSNPAGARAAADALAAEAAPYQARLAELAAVDTRSAGAVVEPAPLPAGPSGAGSLQAGGIGALLGLAAGAAAARFRRTAGRRVQGRGDLEAQLGAPVLATVPRTRRDGHDESALVTLAVPDGPAAEAYRGLRARILAMADRRGLKTVMVTGPTPTTDAATPAIAANLAVSMAATGREVALLSADLRSPELHRYFGMANDRGLSNVLAGELAPSEAAQEPPGLATLHVLAAGPAVPEPSALLESANLRGLLDERREASDFVVIEAPPALSAAEALTLAPMVDGIVVVADARLATREELAETGEQLRLVGGNVLGAVLCNARA